MKAINIVWSEKDTELAKKEKVELPTEISFSTEEYEHDIKNETELRELVLDYLFDIYEFENEPVFELIDKPKIFKILWNQILTEECYVIANDEEEAIDKLLEGYKNYNPDIITDNKFKVLKTIKL